MIPTSRHMDFKSDQLQGKYFVAAYHILLFYIYTCCLVEIKNNFVANYIVFSISIVCILFSLFQQSDVIKINSITDNLHLEPTMPTIWNTSMLNKLLNQELGFWLGVQRTTNMAMPQETGCQSAIRSKKLTGIQLDTLMKMFICVAHQNYSECCKFMIAFLMSPIAMIVTVFHIWNR